MHGEFEVRPGERAWLALSHATSEQGGLEGLDPDASIRDLKRTIEYWEDWAARCRYQGRYRDKVLRSALALKLLTYEPTGAVVAAPCPGTGP
ncbi:MAG: glycoside hydrolase family 15 protein, partial [Chloroflexi bacterium]|nr:glycoside hydrolase family 15 protein [Chloroflexota bacterium]